MESIARLPLSVLRISNATEAYYSFLLKIRNDLGLRKLKVVDDSEQLGPMTPDKITALKRCLGEGFALRRLDFTTKGELDDELFDSLVKNSSLKSPLVCCGFNGIVEMMKKLSANPRPGLLKFSPCVLSAINTYDNQKQELGDLCCQVLEATSSVIILCFTFILNAEKKLCLRYSET